MLRQAHPEPGIAQGYWVDTRFHSHDRTLGDRPGVVQDLSALQGHTKPLKGSGLVRDVRRQLYARAGSVMSTRKINCRRHPSPGQQTPLERRYARVFRLAPC